MSRRKLSREREIQLFCRKTPHFSIQRIRDDVRSTSRVALIVGDSFKERAKKSEEGEFDGGSRTASKAKTVGPRLIGFPLVH